MNKKFKNSLLLGLIALIIINDTRSFIVFGEEDVSPKEEVVYIKTKSSGKVMNINVVNIFLGGEILDYGNYKDLKNLSTDDEIIRNADEIKVSSKAGKIYLEGKLENKEIPWDITLKYFLDGKEITVDKLRGASGCLEIILKIDKNEKCQGTFYEDYTLQSEITLDSEKCKNIRTESGTLANAGSQKKILFTKLPGKDLEAHIKADVNDFYMDPININGLKLNLNMDIDESELTGKVEELISASKKLDDGSYEIYKNTENLKGGGEDLHKGIEDLNEGIDDLDKGINKAQAAIVEMDGGISSLDEYSENLRQGSREISDALEKIDSSLQNEDIPLENLNGIYEKFLILNDGLNKLFEGAETLKYSLDYAVYKKTLLENGLDLNLLQNKNTKVQNIIALQIQNIDQKISYLEMTVAENDEDFSSEILELRKEKESLKEIEGLLKANEACFGATEKYFEKTREGATQIADSLYTIRIEIQKSQNLMPQIISALKKKLNDFEDLKIGVNKLNKSYKDFDSGLNSYTDGVGKISNASKEISEGFNPLKDGTKELKNGSNDLLDGSQKLNKGIGDMKDGASKLNEATGELKSQSDTMDRDLNAKMNELLSSVEGEKTPNKSFVSEKNGNIKNLQFVIKTEGIENEEKKERVEKIEAKKSLWQKLLELLRNLQIFKKY